MTGLHGDSVEGVDGKILGLVLGLCSYAILFRHRLSHSTNINEIFPGCKAQSLKRLTDCPWALWSMPEVELLKQINNTNLDCITATKLAGNNRNTVPIQQYFLQLKMKTNIWIDVHEISHFLMLPYMVFPISLLIRDLFSLLMLWIVREYE